MDALNCDLGVGGRYVMAGVRTQIKCVALTITAGATDDVRKGSFIVISYSN